MPSENNNSSTISPSLISDTVNGLDWLVNTVIGDNANSNNYINPIVAYEVDSLNPNPHGTTTPSSKKGDVNINNYRFDDNSKYANNDSGVEIDGFLFFPNEVKAEESYARREYKRTKIMSGGEFVTRGQYIPKEFSFSTTLDIDPNTPDMYDKVFQIMENKPCEIVSPYMGDIFKAEVQIDKTHPKASPSSLKLDIKVKEIVTPKTTVVGDAILEYPSTTTLSDKAVNIKSVTKNEEEDELKNEREQITYDLKAKDNEGNEFVNKYKQGES